TIKRPARLSTAVTFRSLSSVPPSSCHGYFLTNTSNTQRSASTTVSFAGFRCVLVSPESSWSAARRIFTWLIMNPLQ
ncbi:hypothetical protein FIBSPDRAFT_856818, partial [Athelia psychrophila]